LNNTNNTVSLKILEAYTRDVGRGVARLDYESMDSLSASTGDVVEIRGKRRTVAKCLPLYVSDEGKGIVRVDGLVRNNAGVAIGDTVVITPNASNSKILSKLQDTTCLLRCTQDIGN
jgi:transitional endoplasmic reticulum ATPase